MHLDPKLPIIARKPEPEVEPEQTEDEAPKNPYAWFDEKTTPHAVVYLPSGESRTIALAAYRVISGVLQYVPINTKTGEAMDIANLFIGTIELRNAYGTTLNEELFAKLAEAKQ